MWMKWFPWRFIVRKVARAQGFLDPISLLTSLQRFAQPSEVMAPTELLRAGAVLQARGLMNSQAIQHNLDWIWPFWVVRQFDPKDAAFVPRAFNITHINLTHRNWTAVGVPDEDELPIVDPRGLVTPFLDGWSIDAWTVDDAGRPALVPARAQSAEQALDLKDGVAVVTTVSRDAGRIASRAEVVREDGAATLRISYEARGAKWLAVSLRPYNPEGVSFIHRVAQSGASGWKVNDKRAVLLDREPDRFVFSEYRKGDVANRLAADPPSEAIECPVGMATTAALFPIEPGMPPVQVSVRLEREAPHARPAAPSWTQSLENHTKLDVPNERYRFLYDAAVRTLILHSPGDAYPGPYTYKRFWFRDAAFILNALMSVNLAPRAERVIDRFPSRQTPFGYFLSQEGEWDSNGEALWTVERWCRLTGREPKPEWKSSMIRAGRWIHRKRLAERGEAPHRGLLPAGFSAEHLGPNDYYYWDNFWSVAGLQAAAALAARYEEKDAAESFRVEAASLSRTLERSIRWTSSALGTHAIPASPYRRMDAGAIGSIAAGYPLELWEPGDPRILATAEFLMASSFVDGGFFQEISHSGVNPYLTLHVAQVLMRAGDPRAESLIDCIAHFASPTGQWPEAVHPRTRGGCMGDGQHVWAAAEWVLVMRNAFVKEEGDRLVFGLGVFPSWLKSGRGLSFGPAPTAFGDVSVRFEPRPDGGVRAEWEGRWRGHEPSVEIRLPEREPVVVGRGKKEALAGRPL